MSEGTQPYPFFVPTPQEEGNHLEKKGEIVLAVKSYFSKRTLDIQRAILRHTEEYNL